ncbi:amino acid permease [Escherichia coli]|uniref:amino acid permease n=3 Tax=Escherichia coli TaxID=562 RepID=UPI00098995BB|nr:amino acid permease [Escherichia coli O121:H19]OTD23915.1 hypothetical protein AW091_11205 [Escherichia coli]OTD64096.1 hypothetical protein AW101_14610 [Escherichia coli]RFR18178.1 amino acid permease [Escherichia coli]
MKKIPSAPCRMMETSGVLYFGCTWPKHLKYTGMASICYMTGEIKNPGKTMPRALIGSCLLVLVLYTLLALVISGLMPFDKLANSETPISDALTWIPALGSTAGIFVAITAMIVILVRFPAA